MARRAAQQTTETVKQAETKQEKFVRLGAPRMTALRAAIRRVKALSSYEFSEEMMIKMFSSIDRDIDEMKTSFKKAMENDGKVGKSRDFFTF